MSKTIDFYYDYGSPATYLAWSQIYKLAEKHGATVVRKPALLGGIFKETGNAAPANVPAKGKWLFKDLNRYADKYGVSMQFNSAFPINTIYLMRGALYAQQEGFIEAYDEAVFNAVWRDNKNMGDPEVVGAVLTEAGFDAAAIMAATQNPDIKKKLFAVTAEAVENGLFGMPAFIVDGELYWGQDRMDWVEDAIS